MRARPDWDEYFLSIAHAVAARADCTRRRVGAVIVRDNRIVATGYNGAPAGEPGCATRGACPRGRLGNSAVAPGSSYDTGAGSCIALHAEQNALLYADRDRCEGATLYLVCLAPDGALHADQTPCGGCARMIRGSGVSRLVTP